MGSRQYDFFKIETVGRRGNIETSNRGNVACSRGNSGEHSQLQIGVD